MLFCGAVATFIETEDGSSGSDGVLLSGDELRLNIILRFRGGSRRYLYLFASKSSPHLTKTQEATAFVAYNKLPIFKLHFVAILRCLYPDINDITRK